MTELIDPVPNPDPTPNPDPAPAPVYFGSDGTLKEGWQGTLDEGYREEKSLSTVDNAKVLAKMFVDTKRMVGKNTIAIPTDASPEGEWAEFYKAGGRPETVADYNFVRPNDFPEELYHQDYVDGVQNILFKFGGNKKLAEALFEHEIAYKLKQVQAKTQNDELEMQTLKNGLFAEWGAAYEQRKHFGNIAIEEGASGDAEFKQRLVSKFGNDPDFIKYSANLGGKFSEGKSPDFTNVPTPANLQTQINEIEANPLYLKGTEKQRMELANKVLALRTKIKEAQTKTI